MLLTRNEAPGGFVNGDVGVVIGFRQLTPDEARALEEQAAGGRRQAGGGMGQAGGGMGQAGGGVGQAGGGVGQAGGGVVGEGVQLEAGEASALYPVVRFRRANQRGERERLVLPANLTRRLYRVGLCVRRRLPLQLAWAITVHKSQGMSLPLLQVELDNAFAEGQVSHAPTAACNRRVQPPRATAA